MKSKIIALVTMGTFIISLCHAQSWMYLRTPNGSRALVEVRQEEDPPWIERETTIHCNEYPNAHLVDSASMTYNCFAYAFILAQGGPTCIYDVDNHNRLTFLADSSYRTCSAGDADIVVYGSGNSHIGVLISPDTIISKWGSGPLMRHHIRDCQYWEETPIVTYYYKVDPRKDSRLWTTNIKNKTIGGVVRDTNYIMNISEVIIDPAAKVFLKGYKEVNILPPFSAKPNKDSNVHIIADYNRESYPTRAATLDSAPPMLPHSRSFAEIDESIVETISVEEVIVNIESEKAHLCQNAPNPFTGETVIGYYIPETAQSAYLRFMTAMGVVVKAINISAFGEGEVSISANELSPGVYFYTLIVDGQIINSRQMVVRD